MGIKSTLDTLLGGATTAAFSIPEAGPYIAGALAVGKSLFDMFYPKPKIDPDKMAVNVDQFKTAMTDLKDYIDTDMKIVFEDELVQLQLSAGMTCAGDWLDYLTDKEIKMGLGLWDENVDFTHDQYLDWRNKLNRFAEPIDGNKKLLTTLNFLDLHLKSRFKHLDICLLYTSPSPRD